MNYVDGIEVMFQGILRVRTKLVASLWYRNRLMVIGLFFAVFLAVACQRNEGKRIFETGLRFWEEGKYDDAIQNFVALTKAFPEHELVDDSLFWIANIYEQYLDDPGQAVRFYRSLNNSFARSSYHFQSMLGLARVRAQQGDEGKRKAIRIYKRLQTLKKTPLEEESWKRNQFKLPQLFFELKQYEQARAELKRIILSETNPDLIAKAYYKIGRSYYIEGKIDLAKVTFSEADKKFDHSKKSLDSAISLADIYEEIGELSSAITIYKTILDRLERKEIFYQLAVDRIKKLKLRLRKTNT